MKKTEKLTEIFDKVLNYDKYPDFIVDILCMFDENAKYRFNENYLNKKTGLMINNDKANKILLSSFPSTDVFEYINEREIYDSLLFVKHPLEWEELGVGFRPMKVKEFEFLMNRRISVYSAHSPLDNNVNFSPSKCFSENWPFKIVDDLAQNGRNFGYIIETNKKTFNEIKEIFMKIVSLPNLQEIYSHNDISRIAIVAGGGDDVSWAQIAKEKNCDTYVTGILKFVGSEYAQENNPKFIKFLENNNMNGFGGSHYLTEIQGMHKFSKYLSSLTNIPVFFIEENKKISELKLNWGK